MESTNIYIKIFGLTLDSKLTWRFHVTKLTNEAKNQLNIIKTLSNFEWGIESKTL